MRISADGESIHCGETKRTGEWCEPGVFSNEEDHP